MIFQHKLNHFNSHVQDELEIDGRVDGFITFSVICNIQVISLQQVIVIEPSSWIERVFSGSFSSKVWTFFT